MQPESTACIRCGFALTARVRNSHVCFQWSGRVLYLLPLFFAALVLSFSLFDSAVAAFKSRRASYTVTALAETFHRPALTGTWADQMAEPLWPDYQFELTNAFETPTTR